MTQLWNKGPWFLWEMVAAVTPEAVKFLAVYSAFEALLMVFMPGKTFIGPTTAGGNRPVYKVRILMAGESRIVISEVVQFLITFSPRPQGQEYALVCIHHV
jgi:hypothetical protein